MKKCVLFGLIIATAAVEAASYKEAHEIYRTCFTNPPPGLVSGGGYLFHVFDSFPGRNERETIMKDQMRVLSGYVGRPKDLQSPFTGELTEILTPLVRFKLPSFQAFVVERKYHENDVRVVTAMEAAPIEDARTKVNEGRAGRWTLVEWADVLRTAYLKKSDVEGQIEFLNQLGATRRILSLMDSADPVATVVDFLSLRVAEASWSSEHASRLSCWRLLKQNPVFAPAYKRLSELDASEGKSVDALAHELLAGLGVPDIEGVAERAKAMGAVSWREFANLYARFQEHDLAFGGKAPLWAAVRGTGGRVAFTHGPTSVNDMGAFVQAKDLFKPYKGKNVEVDLCMALSLLVKSIECDPSDSEKWRYYAAAQRAAHHPREAALAYLQTLTLNPDDQVAAADLIVMYDELGYKNLAEGDSWWMVMSGRTDDPAVKKVAEGLRRRHNGVFAD